MLQRIYIFITGIFVGGLFTCALLLTNVSENTVKAQIGTIQTVSIPNATRPIGLIETPTTKPCTFLPEVKR